MNYPQLQNDLIRFRAVEPEDLDLFYHWENSPEYWQYGNTLMPYSRFAIKEYLSADNDIYANKQLRFIIETKKDAVPIGNIELSNIDFFHQRGELGILIDKEFQGNGYAVMAIHLLKEYACNYIGLKQLYCVVSERNISSSRMLIKAGFECNGRLKKWIKLGEEYQDAVFYQYIHQ